mgnify:CR=1 FL=1
MKKALICLEKLDIGGVETFTITQIEEFVRRGIECYVLSKDGILREKLNDIENVKWVEFDFKLERTLNHEKINELEKLILKKKIDFIYVHQFSCVEYILPIALKHKIPYVAYLHNIVPKTCEWFMEQYEIYKTLFPIYFRYASKIIAITTRVYEEHINLFKLPKEKYIILNNSLDFSKYPNKKIEKLNMNFDKLLWFGRVSEQKRNSIEIGIEFYEYIKKYNKSAKLTIVGDGEILEEFKEKYSKKNIDFIGAVSDMTPYIEDSDILLGVDRCMLEAVASKKPAIICGYKKNIVLVTPSIIKAAIKENFTGINLKDDKEEILKYNEKELKKIIEKNYSYVKEKLQITNSVYLDIEPMESINLDLNQIIENTNSNIEKICSLEKESKKLFLDNQRLYSLINRTFKQKIFDRIRDFRKVGK